MRCAVLWRLCQWIVGWMVSCAVAATVVVANQPKTDNPFRVIRYSADELVVECRLPPYRLDTIVTVGGWRAIYPRVEGECSVGSRIAGVPMAQYLDAMIAVPSTQIEWSLTIENTSVKWYSLPLVPYPEADRAPEQERLRFVINPDRYAKHSITGVAFSVAGISRGIPLGRLRVPVIDYDPASNRTRIIERCTVRIRFQKVSAIATSRTDTRLPILNWQQLQLWMTSAKAPVSQRRTTPFVFATDAPFVQVSVGEEGIYAISADQLASLGIRIPTDLVPTIKLYGYGGRPLPEKPSDGSQNTPVEQPILVETNPDGTLRSIVFYAEGPRGFAYDQQLRRWRRYVNPYTTKTSYLLTWGGAHGKRLEPKPLPDGPVTATPQYFIQRLLLETDRTNAYTSPSGRRWLGDPFDATTGITITTPLPGLAPNGSMVEYAVCVAHRDEKSALIGIAEHGTPLRTLSLPGRGFQYSEYVSIFDTVRAPIELYSDGRMVLRLTYSNAANPVAVGLLDYIEVHYPALLTAQANALHIYTEPTDTGNVEYSVGGFSGTPLCLDVTDPSRPQLCRNVSMVQQQALFRVALDSTQRIRPRQFYISAERRRAELSLVEVGDARNPALAADLIVIAPKSFLPSATAYAQYRTRQSHIGVVVMPIEHIFTAFAAGAPDPTAVRDFIAFAYFNWQQRPRYVLFWGDGHYDYRGITTTAPNWIPPYENDNVEQAIGTPYDWSYADDTFVTEDYFGCVDGDDPIMDVAIGRLPIVTDAIGQQIAEKIRLYETRSARDSWQTTVTLVADDGPTSNGRSDGAIHVNSSEVLSKVITDRLPAMIQRKVYLPEFPLVAGAGDNRKPSASEAMLSIINGQGTLLLNWMGHGNPRVWAHEQVFDRDRTIPLLRNSDKNFFLIAATCDFSRFDMTDAQSGGEAILQWTLGGAIGVFSAARVVYTIGNESISRRFYEELSERNLDGTYRTLGDIMLAIKQTAFGSNDQRYLLLGDPSLRLQLPRMVVTIDSIDANATNDTAMIDVCSLSRLRITGSVRDPLTGQRLDTFNGAAVVSLFDPDIQLRIQDQSALALYGDATYYQFWKLGGMLHRGTYTVSQGVWQAEFIVPKDVTLSSDRCRIHTFTFDAADSLDGMGVSRSLRIDCVSLTSVEDRTGPTIGIYLDSRRFQPGDIVRSTPVLIVDLWDESGINTTGIGIGHKIEAWVDDNLDALDLTEFFETSPSDSRGGTAQKQLSGLTPGVHSIRVRAWDVWNNYSEARTWFLVSTNDSIIQTGWVTVAPQPFSDNVTITYNHNQSTPVTARLSIAQLDGRLVWQHEAIPTDVHSTSFVWDGRSAEGYSLPAGVYSFTIEIANQFGSRAVIRGFLVKIQ